MSDQGLFHRRSEGEAKRKAEEDQSLTRELQREAGEEQEETRQNLEIKRLDTR